MTTTLINQLKTTYSQGKLAQSMLFVGPSHAQIELSILELAQLVLCQRSTDNACGVCADCQMVLRMEHPDLEWVKPEKEGRAVKIDQIRELQSSAYLSPKRAKHRMIVIESADRMNTASSNALLKILEEPPVHMLFVLIADQIATVLPTILSRCHVYRIAAPEFDNVLKIAESYALDSQRGMLFSQHEQIIQGLMSVIDGTTHPCSLVATWNEYELESLLWFLYLVYAQTYRVMLTKTPPQGAGIAYVLRLASKINAKIIFMQIDKIYQLLRKISHNMNINQALALEQLLFDLYPT